MKINVFCGWGVAEDVGINIFRTPQEIAAYPSATLVPVDLTREAARTMAAELIAAADLADQYDRDYDACVEDNEQP